MKGIENLKVRPVACRPQVFSFGDLVERQGFGHHISVAYPSFKRAPTSGKGESEQAMELF